MVTHLADQDDVGCLAQHGANDQGEVEPDLVPDFDLIDPRQVVLDRVLGGDDFAVGTVQRVQCRVQRGGLSRPGRAGHQNDSVGAADQRVEVAEVPLGEPQLADADLDVVFVQQPHDAGLAVVGRDDADPQVELLVAHGDLDPPVGRSPLFGDVDLGQDLDAGDDRREHPAGGAFAFDADAVDPIADPDPILKRLDMDVAGPQLDRFLDHQVDQPDHRGAAVVDRPRRPLGIARRFR